MVTKKRYLVLPLTYLILSYATVAFVKRTTYLALTSEDTFFEVVGALGFFVASALLVIAYFRSRNARHRLTHTPVRQLSYLALALVCFLGAGEEISWGQRIFNIETPAVFALLNLQDEITIHNLAFFLPGESGKQIILSTWTSRLFNLIWVFFGLVVPITAALYESARRWLNKFMPIMPWSVGLLFAVNYALFKVSTATLIISAGRHTGANEVKESNIGVLFAVAALYITHEMLSLAPPLQRAVKSNNGITQSGKRSGKCAKDRR